MLQNHYSFPGIKLSTLPALSSYLYVKGKSIPSPDCFRHSPCPSHPYSSRYSCSIDARCIFSSFISSFLRHQILKRDLSPSLDGSLLNLGQSLHPGPITLTLPSSLIVYCHNHFSISSSLTRHIRLHTLEKLFGSYFASLVPLLRKPAAFESQAWVVLRSVTSLPDLFTMWAKNALIIALATTAVVA